MEFTQEQIATLKNAIGTAEKHTSGEIRLHIDKACDIDPLDRAADVFAELEMHKTEQRNGVLFYIALDSKKFAILGDAGINQKVEKDFWDKEKELMLEHFKKGELVKGLSEGIKLAGKRLAEYFPYERGDVNELSDEISFGYEN